MAELPSLAALEPIAKAAIEPSLVEHAAAVAVTIAKASYDATGATPPATNARPNEYEQQQAFLAAGALLPPYDPWQLSRLYERSSNLRPNINAYEANIAGFGHQLAPVIDLEASGAKDEIKKALRKEALSKGLDDFEPSDAQVEEARVSIERAMFGEEFKLERFFAACAPLAPGRSLIQLRKESIVDQEVTGNAYWEVVRRLDGKVCHFNRVESRSMRLRAIQPKALDVQVPERASPFRYEKVTINRRFRSYVQIVLGVETVFFKEFGDPRVMNSKTGGYYDSTESMRSADPNALAATEILHWATFVPTAPYGVPRWIGAQFQVLGALASEQVNHDYFDKKAIPDFAVLVSGGKLRDGAVDLIKQHLKSLQGREHFHETMILEAESSGAASGNGARCVIEIKSLRDSLPQDALFQEYEENCAKKVQQQFRLPDLLVGRSQEANRAQAEAALQMAEQQVIQPRRQDFDEVMNNVVLADMGILWWQFKSNSAVAKDPELQTKLGTEWMKCGALTPAEGRLIAGEVFNKDFPQIDEAWTKQPLPLTLAGIIPGSALAPSAGGDGSGPPQLPPGAAAAAAPGAPKPAGEQKAGDDVAMRMLMLAQQLRAGASDTHAVAMASVRGNAAARVFKIPDSMFKSWFADDAPSDDEGERR